MWRRALELYLGSVILSLFFTWAALATNHPSIKDGLYDVINWPHIIYETLLMRYGFGWADFLSRFAILMFLAPFGFYLLAKNKWWLLLIASLSAWAFRGENFTLGWQLIFALGMITGYYWNALSDRWADIKVAPKKRIIRYLLIASTITFVLSYASVYLLSVLNQRWLELPLWLQSFTFHWNSVNAYVWQYGQKWTMGPVRIILFFMWFWSLFYIVNRYHRQVSRYSLGILELFGRNSLFVYIAHAFIVFGFKFIIPSNTSIWENFIITAAALLCLVVVTVAYTKQRSKSFQSKNTRSDISGSSKLEVETL
jgi:hypothetical protein